MQNRNNAQNNNQDYNNYGQSYGYNSQNSYDNSYPGAYDTYSEPMRDEMRMRKGKNNNALFVVTLCISIVAIVVCAAAIFLFVTKDDSEPANENETVSVSQDEEESEEELQNAVEEETEEKIEEEPKEEPKKEEPKKETKPQTIPVGYNMYVTASDFLVLRSGPSVNYSEITRMYHGDSVYVVEYVSDTFARVSYNGTQGYAARQYLSTTKPQPVYQWEYSEYEIESVVANSLHWFVGAVNSGDTSGAEYYFKGAILQTEKNNAKKISEAVASETLLRVNCYNYKRLSPTRVSVTRASDIEIVEWNGSSRVASETRVYVLENTGSGTYIVDIHK